MDLILCHIAADFDTLGAAVGATHLYPGSKIALAGSAHPAVQDFLVLHRDAYPLIELRAVNPESLRRIILVDCHDPSRLDRAAEWLKLAEVEIHIYDHHSSNHQGDPENVCRDLQQTCLAGVNVTQCWIEPVGSTCTLIVERIQNQSIELDRFERTALALGIHVDTGSLTFPSSTVRDAQALTWLMQKQINLTVLAEYIDPGLSPQFQQLLAQGLQDLQIEEYEGYQLATWVLILETFTPGLAGLVSHLIDLTDVDVLILVAQQANRISLIGRSRYGFAQLQRLMHSYGGGGHARAASATIKDPTEDPQVYARDRLNRLKSWIPRQRVARDLMSSPVRTIRPETTIEEAQRILLRYGHSGLVVAGAQAQVVGVISRRDLDIALHHGFGHAPVKGYMTAPVQTITPQTPLTEIQTLMTKWDIGRLPVLQADQLIGIVTRTDVLRHLHDLPEPVKLPILEGDPNQPERYPIHLRGVAPFYQEIWNQAALIADRMGLQLYLVGGAVRDLLLGLETDDLDLVVDGPYPLVPGQDAIEGWGVQMGRALHQIFPESRMEIHGKFQTVALTWPNGVWIDIATARTEFYPYPAAPPEVALGSIQQDLYRRDFTINALAMRLNSPEAGQVLDFFGGMEDLNRGVIRVLHPNSFIEDPTRIFRAVRFAVRLGFQVDPQTDDQIRRAVASGLHDAVGGDRLKHELHSIFNTNTWPQALDQLAVWGALRCIHPDLIWSSEKRDQVRRAGFWARHFAQVYPEISTHERWQLRLEALIADLPQATQIGRQLHLTQAGLDRLAQFPLIQDQILPSLQPDLRPSQVVKSLHSYSVPLIILSAAMANRDQRLLIGCYLKEWRRVKPLLSGHDLKAMGYKPGRAFQEILWQLQQLTLDGQIHTKAEAEAFVRDRFPDQGMYSL